MSEADKQREDDSQDNVSRNERFSDSDDGNGQGIPQLDQGLFHEEDLERVEIEDELEQILEAVDWTDSDVGSVDQNRNEDAYQVDRYVVGQVQDDSLGPVEQDTCELDMDDPDEELMRMWRWINSNPELREFAESYVNGESLLPRPPEVDLVGFREAFVGQDLIEFLERERQRHLGLATVQNQPGVLPSPSQSDTDRKGKRPDKYKCRICGVLKRDIPSEAGRPGRPHVCRPTREQIIKEIKYRINKRRKKESRSTNPPPAKRTKLGRSDSGGSDGYMCNKCGERKSGHICQVPDVIGRIAQRIIDAAAPGADTVDEKTIQEAVDNEDSFKFSETDGRLIVTSEVPPAQNTDQRPVRWSSQAEENIRLLQQQRDQQTSHQEEEQHPPGPEPKEDDVIV